MPKWSKNGFWGHFRPFGGHFYPFWTIWENLKIFDFYVILVIFWHFWPSQPYVWWLWLGGGCSLRAENTARAESVLLAAARFRCLRERVGTTCTRFYPLDAVESIGATLSPLREACARRRALAMATQDEWWFQGGASQPDPGDRPPHSA